MIAHLFKQLFLEMKASNSPLWSYLQPGISKEVVDNNLTKANLDVAFPDEIYSLYEWHNGVNENEAREKDIGELSLFKLGIFSSLSFAIDNYIEYAVQNSYWSKGLFPLFESGGGDYYLIDSNKHSATYKMIFFYSPSNSYFQGVASIFDSLDSLLSSVIECYREKAYYFSPDSPDLEIKPKLEMAIWRKHNPNSEYYRILDKYNTP